GEERGRGGRRERAAQHDPEHREHARDTPGQREHEPRDEHDERRARHARRGVGTVDGDGGAPDGRRRLGPRPGRQRGAEQRQTEHGHEGDGRAATQPTPPTGAHRRAAAGSVRAAATWIARTTAAALLRVSTYSVSGSESATRPAPACTVARPSATTAVPIAIAASMSPARSKPATS